jgi:hypothetical protein
VVESLVEYAKLNMFAKETLKKITVLASREDIRKLHVLMNVNRKYLYFYNPALMAVRAGCSGHRTSSVSRSHRKSGSLNVYLIPT